MNLKNEVSEGKFSFLKFKLFAGFLEKTVKNEGGGYGRYERRLKCPIFFLPNRGNVPIECCKLRLFDA